MLDDVLKGTYEIVLGAVGRPEREVCEALGNIPNLSEIQNELDTCRAPSLPQVAMLENIT